MLIFSTLTSFSAVAQPVHPSADEQVTLAKLLIPNLKKAAVITNIKEKESALKELLVAGKTHSVTFQIFDLASVSEVREAFQLAVKSNAEVIWLLDDKISNHQFGRRLILERSLSAKIPVYSWSKDFLREGALFAFEKDSTGETVTYFNQKIAALIDVNVPSTYSSKLTNFP